MKKESIIRYALIAGIIALLIFPAGVTLLSPAQAVVKDTQGQFFRAKSILVIGATMFCRRSGENHPSRELALKETPGGYTFARFNVRDINLIEFIPQTEEPAAAGSLEGKYLGLYQVKVTGHVGFLYLAEKDGVLYGTIRFPQWANGVAEPLKNVRFTGGRISFTRSVTDARELRRIGANSYFVQQYSGEYNADGKVIRGFYVKDGAKLLWEAYRIR